jgi:hypothetical protein
MKIQLAGLRFLLRAATITILHLVWSLAVTHFPFVLLVSTLTREITI